MEESNTEEDKDNPTGLNEINEDPTCLIVTLTQEENKELCRPWKSSLIIKLLGKRLGMKFLKLRIQKMWVLRGSFEFLDMENDYYLV